MAKPACVMFCHSDLKLLLSSCTSHVDLADCWHMLIQDKTASDSMEPTMQLMQVNRLIRSAIRLVKGTELRQTADSFEIAVLSGILWFKASASPA